MDRLGFFLVILIIGNIGCTIHHLSDNLPETRRRPDDNCLRKTTRFPRNRPASKINTVPAVIFFRSLGGFRTGVGPFFGTASSAG